MRLCVHTHVFGKEYCMAAHAEVSCELWMTQHITRGRPHSLDLIILVHLCTHAQLNSVHNPLVCKTVTCAAASIVTTHHELLLEDIILLEQCVHGVVTRHEKEQCGNYGEVYKCEHRPVVATLVGDQPA